MPVTLPTSWTDQGMDWSDPDPFSAVYWRALMVALSERLAVTGFFNDYGKPDGMSTLLFGDSFLMHPDSSLNTSGLWLIEGWLWQVTANSQWIDIAADLASSVPTYRLPSGYIGQVYAEAGRYYVTPEDILIPELLPWVTPAQLKGELSLSLAKRYLRQRKAFIDCLLYCIRTYPLTQYSLLDYTQSMLGKYGSNDSTEVSNLSSEKQEAEAAYAALIPEEGSYDNGFYGISMVRSQINTGSEGWCAAYLHKIVSKVRLDLAFPFACNIDHWATFIALGEDADDENEIIRYEFNASGVTSNAAVTSPGTYKIDADVVHAASAGGSSEWKDFGYAALTTPPPWYSGTITLNELPERTYHCGCQVDSGFFVLKFNIAGGFAFRPST